MGKIKDGKLLYHLVPLNSLESIIANNLLSRAELYSRGIKYTDTADHEILAERERLNLSAYVPFHFHIHTTYDLRVKRANDCEFVYLCLHRDYAKANRFLILPCHPASNEKPDVHPYEEGLCIIDWDTMEMTQEQAQMNGCNERYRNQVRMAECLSPNSIAISDFLQIVVRDEDTVDTVHKLLDNYNIKKPPYVNIQNWF